MSDILNDQDRLEELYWGGGDDEWREAEDKIIATTRWGVVHRKAFEERLDQSTKGIPRILLITCEHGATEYQENSPVDARFGRKHTETVTVYA